MEAVEDHARRQGPKRGGGPLDFRYSGEEGEDRPCLFGEREAAGGSDLRLDPGGGVAPEIAQGEGKGLALRAQGRRVA